MQMGPEGDALHQTCAELTHLELVQYTSKPLGLRSPSAKARLILLDIFFIVFDSANLSFASTMIAINADGP
jgi:hypothetical protein